MKTKGLGTPSKCVYFVLAPKTELVKIGRADDPDKRLKSMQTGSPDVLDLILVLPNTPPFEEYQLHGRFAKYRAHGEWFEYRDELVRFIEEKKLSPSPTEADDRALYEAEELDDDDQKAGLIVVHHQPDSHLPDKSRVMTGHRPFRSPAYGIVVQPVGSDVFDRDISAEWAAEKIN